MMFLFSLQNIIKSQHSEAHGVHQKTTDPAFCDMGAAANIWVKKPHSST